MGDDEDSGGVRSFCSQFVAGLFTFFGRNGNASKTFHFSRMNCYDNRRRSDAIQIN